MENKLSKSSNLMLRLSSVFDEFHTIPIFNLDVLKYIKEFSDIVTKSGLMVGLSEDMNEIEETLIDLKQAGVDIITIGQYIQPSKQHLEVAKYYTPEEFENLRKLAEKIGFKNYQIDPLVRSSYKAAISWQEVKHG